MSFRALLAAVLLLLPQSLAAAEPPVASLPSGVTAGASIEGVAEYRLANGLRVLLFPDGSTPTVTVNISYGAGSADENYGETGMAHLLEHLMFKGTPTHADIPGAMTKRGIGYNATTSFDRTNYFASFPADDATLQWVLALEADRMVNTRVARDTLDSEMTVVRNELEAGENNPGGVLAQRVRSTGYLWHNYGHSTIGVRSDVEGVSIARLQAFYRTWYQPDTATLVVAGRIDDAATLAMIANDFGALPGPSRALPTRHTVEPAQDGERMATVRGVGDLRFVMAAWHVPAMAQADSAPLAVLADILGDVPGGRLHKALVEPKFAAASAAGSEARRDPGLFTAVAVVPKDGDVDKARDILLAQTESLAEHPIIRDELDRAKQRIANAYDLYFTDVNAVGMGLTEFQAAGDWRLLFLTRDAVAATTLADVNRVAAAYLKRSNRTLGEFIPTDAPDRVQVSPAPDIAPKVATYRGREAVAAGESFDPTPANIESRTTRFTLGNGLKIALLPKTTRGGTVVVSASFRFGDAGSLTPARAAAASLAGAMLMRGSTTMSREQISQRFDALNTQANVSGGLQGAAISMLSRSDQLAEALALAAEVLRHPAFTQAEFGQLKLQALTGLQASRKEPGSVAGLALARHFDPWPVGHPLHVLSLDESIARLDALTVDDLRAFHRDFYGTADGEIAIVGDFDADAVRAQLETLFADWTSPYPYAPISTRYTAVPAERKTFETPDKPSAVLLARGNLSLRVTDDDYPAMMIANAILGGSALKSRLGDRIRQKDGLSYGISSAIGADDSIGGTDDSGSLSVQAIAAPQNMAKVQAALREELQRFVADGVTEDELRDAVAGTLVQRRQARAADGAIAGMLADQAYFGRTMQFTADLDAKYAALTVDAVDAAIRKRIDPTSLSLYAAGDFAAAGRTPTSTSQPTPPDKPQSANAPDTP